MDKVENTNGLHVTVENSSEVYICSSGKPNTVSLDVNILLEKINTLEHQRDHAVSMYHSAMGELDKAVSQLKFKDTILKARYNGQKAKRRG